MVRPEGSPVRQWRQHDVPRETFIALRARREAYQIATDILYEKPVDIFAVECPACADAIDLRVTPITDPLGCPACGAAFPLPAYLKRHEVPYAGRAELEWPPLIPPDRADEAAIARMQRELERDVSPTVWWFTLCLFNVLLIANLIAQWKGGY